MNKLIEKAKQNGNGNSPQFYCDGNFCCCVIKHKNKTYCGFAKRNPNCDEHDVARGRKIAHERALKNLMLGRAILVGE